MDDEVEAKHSVGGRVSAEGVGTNEATLTVICE